MDTPCHRAGIRAYRASLAQVESTLREAQATLTTELKTWVSERVRRHTVTALLILRMNNQFNWPDNKILSKNIRYFSATGSNRTKALDVL